MKYIFFSYKKSKYDFLDNNKKTKRKGVVSFGVTTKYKFGINTKIESIFIFVCFSFILKQKYISHIKKYKYIKPTFKAVKKLKSKIKKITNKYFKYVLYTILILICLIDKNFHIMDIFKKLF
ncbi:hypothetical protein [Campylobacter pinnipediorum]|uniref:hypothetical protein n=1 Tax=Campylobacter pinnipediorum TaxID=1965231 RepID=UPI000994BE46|nr:hypothetical protein [Campylobacter pinnipediorum]AQW82317.1 putative membrane protein [Campylobacter pinnipediorum subsp. pinnipediorum]